MLENFAMLRVVTVNVDMVVDVMFARRST